MDTSDDIDEEDFGFSRNYFLAKESGNSIKKSNSKISDIGIINEQELMEAMSTIEPKHEKEIKALKDSYRSLYSQWRFEIRCGFGLLYYGFGSKRTLLEDFASTSLTDYTVVVINGYLPSINIKQVAVGLADVFWEVLKARRKTSAANSPMWKQPTSSQSMDEIISFLNGPWGEDELFICIVVHNIDGPGLRDSNIQQYLAQIAACSHIRIIASIDHVNAPLLWDKKMADLQFNWFWHHTPTFEPYSVEGMFFPLILTNGSLSQNAKSASIVLQSLTPNAQSVFRVVAEHQIAHPDEEGMQISNLYMICRERFLVSSQVTLNSYLTEFKDHDLVKTRRHQDGEDCLHIPLSNEALQKLLQDIS